MHHLLLLGEWCFLDWLGVTWEPPTKIVELNQGVCKGKEITYFVKIYPSEESPSWAMAMVG